MTSWQSADCSVWSTVLEIILKKTTTTTSEQSVNPQVSNTKYSSEKRVLQFQV